MKPVRVQAIAILWGLLIGAGTGAAIAQPPPQRPLSDPTAVTSTPQEKEARPLERIEGERVQELFERRSWGPVLRVGTDYILRNGESVRDVFVISSSATIEGRVWGDVTVVFGTLRLSSTATIDGSLIVVGGSATVEPGAAVRQSLMIVGGALDAPPDFGPGREHVVIGGARLAERVRGVVPWITEGLLLARPIVPRLGWIWWIVAILFVVSLALNLMFLDAVRACAGAIAAKPLSTFLVGLLVLLLAGPVSVVLAASVIGLAVVPFVLCALVIAWIIGKVGVALWIGGSVVGQTSPTTRPQAVLLFVIGFAAICFAYMVPVLGFIVWALSGVLGLGAATLAFMAAFRRENPAPPQPAAPAPFDQHVAGTPSLPDALPLAQAPPEPPVGPPATTNLALFPRASFLDRLAAFALDTALVLIAANILDLTRHDGAPIILLLAYHIGFWTWKGTTVGGIICQLRVVRVDGSPLRFVDALVRGLSSLFSFAVLGLGCLWILKDPERQAWHDKIAGTYVVKVPRNWPLP